MNLKSVLPFRLLLKVPVPWVYVLAYLFGLGFHLFYPLHFVSPEKTTPVFAAGVILFGVGAIVASWSLLIFKRAKTTTTPGESSKQLILKGPYRFSRNPMYVSLLLGLPWRGCIFKSNLAGYRSAAFCWLISIELLFLWKKVC